MNTFDFDRQEDRSGTHAIKWEGLGSVFGNPAALPLWVADMDFPCPPAVTKALRERATHPIYGYTTRPTSYFVALQRWLARRHHWNIQPEWCLHSPMVVTSLSVLVETLTSPGDGVLIQTPVYTPFFEVIRNNGRVVVQNPLLTHAGTFTMDLDELERSLAGVKMVILCSPHNPVGRVWQQHELEAFARLCSRHGVLVISDEIHADLILGTHPHTPLATVKSMDPSLLVTCVSPSKTFNLAGLGASALVIEDTPLRQKVKQGLARFGLEHTNTFAVAAFEAAFNEGEEWLDALIAYLRGNEAWLRGSLQREFPHLTMPPVEGTYLAWLNFQFLGLSDSELRTFLIHKAGLALEPGTKYGPGGEGHARLNFACPRATLVEAVSRLRSAVRA